MFLGRLHISYIIFFQIIFVLNLWAGDVIQYLSPRPEAKYVPVQTSLIISIDNKWQSTLDLSYLSISVQGEKSGPHEGELDLLEDGITFIFNPDVAFAKDETVSIQLLSHILGYKQSVSYEFTTSN
jgi:hypothetical protein